MFQGKWVDEVVQEVTAAAVKARRASGRSKAPPVGEVQGRVLIRLMLCPLELETHALLARTFPFREDDIPPYVHRLLVEHGIDALPLIKDLLLRVEELDFGPYEVARVIDQLAGLPTNTSIDLPRPRGADYDSSHVLQLAAPPPL
ncbi:MAG: hypothetical protein HYY30_05535 [Chloroflexi bacterium]|nr:hypothetical protein [Chloroflexota bacterium]